MIYDRFGQDRRQSDSSRSLVGDFVQSVAIQNQGLWSRGLRGLGFLFFLFSCSADHYAEEGQKALERHELGVAESHFREALQKEPTHLEALEGIAWTYYLAGQRPAAITAFGRCRELAPERVGCIRGMASIAMGNNELPRARDLIALAMSIAPEDPGVQSSQALLECGKETLMELKLGIWH